MGVKNSIIVFFMCLFVLSACKKNAGIGGQKTIYGTVTFKNGVTSTFEKANTAMVHIAYGTKTSTTEYDQTVVVDEVGAYHFDGLRKGDYFISSEFTDEHGFKYITAGYGVTVNNKKEKLAVDIVLQ
jgi:hypothetical protein